MVTRVAGAFWGKEGYKFLVTLTSAIEGYTREAVSKNNDAFMYNGSSLRYAVERELYFNCANNQPLAEFFGDIVSERPLKEYAFNNYWEFVIACQMKKIVRPDGKGNPVITLSPSPYRLIKGCRMVGGRVVRSVRYRMRPKYDKTRIRGRGIFFTFSERFVRFLKPVADSFPGSCYLFPKSRHLNSYFENSGLFGIPYFLNGEPGFQLPENSELPNFSHLQLLHDSFCDFLSEYEPSFVVLPEGNASFYEIMNLACKKTGVVCVCIQNGWAPYIHNGFRNMSYDAMLVWGKGFADLLAPYNPHQQFVVSGNHNIQKANKSNVSGIGDGISFFFQSPGGLLDQKSWEDMMNLVFWTSNHKPENKVYVREHPAFRFDEYEKKRFQKQGNIVLADAGNWPLSELLEKTIVSVSNFSSTILDSIMFGVLPVVYNETSLPSYVPDIHARKAGIEVKNLEEAKAIIGKLLENPELVSEYKSSMDKFSKEFFQKTDDGHSAVDRIKKEVQFLVARSMESKAGGKWSKSRETVFGRT